jgi:hypothetical protein
MYMYVYTRDIFILIPIVCLFFHAEFFEARDTAKKFRLYLKLMIVDSSYGTIQVLW